MTHASIFVNSPDLRGCSPVNPLLLGDYTLTATTGLRASGTLPYASAGTIGV
jgi:hypothetical protein